MNKKKISSDGTASVGSDASNDFLLSYLSETPLTAADLLAWQGTPIQGQNTKQIFVVDQVMQGSLERKIGNQNDRLFISELKGFPAYN